jgi:hypothetical protein
VDVNANEKSIAQQSQIPTQQQPHQTTTSGNTSNNNSNNNNNNNSNTSSNGPPPKGQRPSRGSGIRNKKISSTSSDKLGNEKLVNGSS